MDHATTSCNNISRNYTFITSACWRRLRSLQQLNALLSIDGVTKLIENAHRTRLIEQKRNAQGALWHVSILAYSACLQETSTRTARVRSTSLISFEIVLGKCDWRESPDHYIVKSDKWEKIDITSHTVISLIANYAFAHFHRLSHDITFREWIPERRKNHW